MAGQIISRGERTWLVRVFLGRDPKTGKRAYHNKTIHGNKKAAQRYLNDALSRRDLGSLRNVAEASISELLDLLILDYKANGQSEYWAGLVVRVHLRPFFGLLKARALDSEYVQRYVTARREPSRRAMPNGKTRTIPSAKNGTINRELALLRRAFNIGKSATPPLVSFVPSIPTLKENNVRKGFFEDAAFISIRRELPEDVRPVATFAYYTGCRRGEILGLRWSQIDFAERAVRLEPGETKNRDARTFFMVPELYEVLSIQKEIRDCYFPDCPWVFTRAGQRIRDFNSAWKSACIKAGLVGSDGKPEKLFHDFRRTGVRNLIRAGVPERVAMMISGHRTRAVFDRYNIVSESDLREAARRHGAYVTEKRSLADDRRTIGTQPAPESTH
jgi:integrase